jgi:hypothetical protein
MHLLPENLLSVIRSQWARLPRFPNGTTRLHQGPYAWAYCRLVLDKPDVDFVVPNIPQL